MAAHETPSAIQVARGQWALTWDGNNGTYTFKHQGHKDVVIATNKSGVLDLVWCLTTIREAQQRDLAIRNKKENTDGAD